MSPDQLRAFYETAMNPGHTWNGHAWCNETKADTSLLTSDQLAWHTDSGNANFILVTVIKQPPGSSVLIYDDRDDPGPC